MAEKNIAGDANANPNFKVDTKALLLKYLSYGKIAHIIGDTMFVHGAITERNKGYVATWSMYACVCTIVSTDILACLIV